MKKSKLFKKLDRMMHPEKTIQGRILKWLESKNVLQKAFHVSEIISNTPYQIECYKFLGSFFYKMPFSLLSESMNDNDVIKSGELTWERFDLIVKKGFPIQYFIREIISKILLKIELFFENLETLWIQQVKNRINPHNIIKIETLSRNYHDEVEILLHVNFQIIKNFLDNHPEQIVDYDSDDDQKKFWNEIQGINKYWNTERPTLLKELDREYSQIDNMKSISERYLKVEELEKTIQEHDQKMLHKIIDIRFNLWW